MYLGPHHFQTQSRYFEDSISFLAASLWHEPWGLLHAELDQKAIRNGSAALLHASGIFPDGLTFELPDSDPPPPARNLLEVFPTTDAVLPLYLAVPSRRDNGFDCDLSTIETGAANGVRFSRMQRTLRDETNGIDEREIELGQKNIRLATEAELTQEMLSIPIAHVLRDGRGHLIYDEDFVPIGACCDADSDYLDRGPCKTRTGKRRPAVRRSRSIDDQVPVLAECNSRSERRRGRGCLPARNGLSVAVLRRYSKTIAGSARHIVRACFERSAKSESSVPAVF